MVFECILALIMLFLITGVVTCLGIFLIDKLINAYVNLTAGKEDDE